MPELDEHGLLLVRDGDGRPIDRSYFWTEGCAIFAVTLARRLQAQGETADLAVLSNPAGIPDGDDPGYELTHVVVSTPQGYIDAMGFCEDPQRLCERIGMPTCDLHGDFDVERFEARYMGPDEQPLYGCDPQTVDWAHRLVDAQPELFMPSATDRQTQRARQSTN